MKRKDLENRLKRMDYRFLRHGGEHDIWVKEGKMIAVPRHKEINEITADKILKQAKPR